MTSSRPLDLQGRTALITGSTGRGMGRSIALTLARHGADIVLNYETRPQRAETMRQTIESMGRRALLVQADASSEEGAHRLVSEATAAFGKVDILVVSAGGAWQPADTAAMTPDHWRKVLAEEVHAPLYLIPPLLPGMRSQRWGRVILIGGHEADDWREDDTPLDYPLGKASRHWLARTLARREASNGITVNAIAPGTIDYVELDDALSDLEHGEAWQRRQKPRPQDAGDIAAFLCSEEARFITGAVIPLTG